MAKKANVEKAIRILRQVEVIQGQVRRIPFHFNYAFVRLAISLRFFNLRAVEI